MGSLTVADVLTYDQQGHLSWAYEGLRGWVQQLATAGAVAALQIPPIEATTPLTASGVTDKPERPLYRRWWVYVVGVLVLLFAIGAISNAVNPPKKSHPVAVQTAATTPTPTPSPPSALPGIGQSVRIGSGRQQVDVRVVKVFRAAWVPFLGTAVASKPGIQLHGGWTFLVVRLQFKNSGTGYYHSVVANWSKLAVRNNVQSNVDASGMEWDVDGYFDLQGDGNSLTDMSQMQIDARRSKMWFVAFKVRKVAQPISFTYQGPGNKKVTWDLR